VESHNITSEMVADLTSLTDDCKGNVELCFNIIDKPQGRSIVLHSHRGGIELKPDLLNYISTNPNLSYSLN
jgi:DNA polymerase-3 subunit alpha